MHPNQYLSYPVHADRPLRDVAYSVYDGKKERRFPLTKAGLNEAKSYAKSLSSEQFISVCLYRSNGQGHTGLETVCLYHNGQLHT
jgi:hypothetical protein